MSLLILITGWMLIPLGCMHLAFPRYFKWETDLADLMLINRQMMIIHTFFIGLMVVLMGCLCVSSSDALVETALGRRLCFGIAIFWGARLLAQFFWFSPKLWKGKKFETLVHVAFSIFWITITAIFGLAAAGI